jgi:hypothetical protein
MAFGIKRRELKDWKKRVEGGEIAFLTHFWLHPRFPGITTVTKAGCSDVNRLIDWAKAYGLKEEWIHAHSQFPHFDLIGDKQLEILQKEGLWDQIERFRIKPMTNWRGK